MRRIYAREEYCIGCRLCEIYCITSHSRYPGNVLKAFKKQHPRPLSRVQVEESRPLSFALQCRHCDDPECIKACITGAMQKDPETGIVDRDEGRCVGCWTCILVCPYGAVRRDLDGGKVASKCDFCTGKAEEPACVAHCPNEALIVSEDEVKAGGQNG